jgi:PleD family two-component response regulator
MAMNQGISDCFTRMVSDLRACPADDEAERRRAPALLSTKGAVLADPDRAFLVSMSSRLAPVFGFDGVRATRSNLCALKLALAEPPELIIASLDDDELDGYALSSALRRNADLKDVALVLTAPHFTQVELRRLYDLGVFRAMLSPPGDWEVRELLESMVTSS